MCVWGSCSVVSAYLEGCPITSCLCTTSAVLLLPAVSPLASLGAAFSASTCLTGSTSLCVLQYSKYLCPQEAAHALIVYSSL